MPVKDYWTKIEGVATHYLEAGTSGSPVVLLHGGSVDSASLSWSATLSVLSQTCRVIAPDLPGYGQSAKPAIHYTLQYYTQFLEHFVQDLGLGRFSLVGLSLGGHVSLGFTLQFPSLVEKLVLVNSAGIGTQWHWCMLAKLMVKIPGLHRRIRRISSRKAIQFGLRRMVHDPAVITEDLINEIVETVAAGDEGWAWRCYLENEMGWYGFRNSFLDRLAEITQPTLIVHGSRDRLIRVKWAKRAHRVMPNSQLCILGQCGHWPPREKSVEFNNALLEFLG